MSLNADKNSDLIAKFENPAERAVALAEISALAKKTHKKVRTYLMKQVGNPDADMAHDAIEAVISIGQPMNRLIKGVLAKGEYKGVAISDSVAAHMALRIDPTGERVLSDYLEEAPLTAAVAAQIGKHAEPLAALQMLLGKVQEEESRALSLTTLRALRQRGAFAESEGVADMVLEHAAELDETMTQVLVDAVVPVDFDKDSARMEAWLKSGDPVQAESALRSIGGAGRSFLDLAPLLAGHLASDSATLRQAAYWTLGRFATGDDAATSQGDAATADESAPKLSKKAQENARLFNILSQAEDGVLGPPVNKAIAGRPQKPEEMELRAEAVKRWQFAPSWIAEMGSGFRDDDFATDTPAWDRSSVPSQIEELMPTLMAALASEDRAISVPAGVSLIEWNVNSIDLLRWAVVAIGTETDFGVLRPIWSLLVRESDQSWMKRTFAVEAFAKALKNQPTEVQTIKLLMRMNTDVTRKVLVEHFAKSNSSRPWHIQHYLALHSLMALSPADRDKFVSVLGRRFVAGDYRVAPLLAMSGDTVHPTLEKAFLSKNLDRRMVAIAVLMEQGTRARVLLPKLRKLSEREPHARHFHRDAIKAIETGQ